VPVLINEVQFHLSFAEFKRPRLVERNGSVTHSGFQNLVKSISDLVSKIDTSNRPTGVTS